jgi:hypothetical protein
VVRWIYQAFVNEGKSELEIAKSLNARSVLTDYGRAWTRGTIHQVLTNEKYIGNNVYHRTSFKLKLKHVVNPQEKWIRADGIFEGIVEPSLFHTAEDIVLARSRKLTNEEMLEKLRGVLKRHGRINGILIDEAEDLPSSAAFRHRFGSLVSAYRLIGYDPGIDYEFIEINRKLRKEHPEIVAAVIGQIGELGAVVSWDEKAQLLYLNNELRVSIVLCRHWVTAGGSSRWVIRLDEGLKPDITVAIRMTATNEAIRDYYLLPAIDMTWENLRMAEENGVYLDGYAEALVLGTPKDQLAQPEKPKVKEGLSAEEIGKLEHEMESLERDLKAVEESYGENMLNLTCARGYIKKLLDNAKVVRFLNANYRDILPEFEAIAAAETL